MGLSVLVHLNAKMAVGERDSSAFLSRYSPDLTLFRHNTQSKCAAITLFPQMPLFRYKSNAPFALEIVRGDIFE